MEPLMDHIGADGVFTEGFAVAAIASLGDEYKDSKYLDGVQSVGPLIKRGIDTQRKNTELSEQLKKGLHKPGDNAGDDEKSTYHKAIRTELGASDNVNDYLIARRDNHPEGMPFSDDAAKVQAQTFCDLGIPVEAAKTLVNATYDAAIAEYNTSVIDKQTKANDEQIAFDTAVLTIHTKHQPDELTVMGRHVVKFISDEGSDDETVDGVTQKGMKTAVAEAGMFESPADFTKWKDIGISPADFLFFARMGEMMSAGGQRQTSDGGGKPSAERQAAITQNKVNELSPAMQVPVPPV